MQLTDMSTLADLRRQSAMEAKKRFQEKKLQETIVRRLQTRRNKILTAVGVPAIDWQIAEVALTEPQYFVLKTAYTTGLTFAQIAEKYEQQFNPVSRQGVDSVLNSAVGRLRKHLGLFKYSAQNQ